jgi:hypothetical protein
LRDIIEIIDRLLTYMSDEPTIHTHDEVTGFAEYLTAM